MTEYRPPLQDMRFVLEHIADLPSLVELDAFSHVDTDVAYGALDEAARFFTEVVLPTNRTGDLEGCVRHEDGSVTTPKGFREAYEQFVAAGWGNLTVTSPTSGNYNRKKHATDERWRAWVEAWTAPTVRGRR